MDNTDTEMKRKSNNFAIEQLNQHPVKFTVNFLGKYSGAYLDLSAVNKEAAVWQITFLAHLVNFPVLAMMYEQDQFTPIIFVTPSETLREKYKNIPTKFDVWMNDRIQQGNLPMVIESIEFLNDEIDKEFGKQPRMFKKAEVERDPKCEN